MPTGNPGSNGDCGGANKTFYKIVPGCDDDLPAAVQSLKNKMLDYEYYISSYTGFLSENIGIANKFNTYLDQNNNEVGAQFVFWGLGFLSQNPNTTWTQFENWFIKGALNYQEPLDVDFAKDLSDLSNDLKTANQNGTLNQLQASWPSWQKIKQKIKAAVATNIHEAAKIVKTYYDEVRNSSFYNAGTRAVLNVYIYELSNEIKSTTDMNVNTMKWEDLFKIWLFELNPSSNIPINFTGNSNVVNGSNLFNPSTNAVKNFPKGEPSILPDIKNGLKNGTFNVSNSMTKYFTYDFSQYYATLSNNNVGIQRLGSYGTKATVISKSGNSAVIRFYISNVLGWDSATRFVQNGNKTVGVITDKEIGQELYLGGNLINNYTWEEVITF